MTGAAPADESRLMDKAEAKALTDRIRTAVDSLWALLIEAHERRAWKALGYETWDAYVRTEFGMTRQRSYQLLDQGKVIEAIREATGDLSNAFDISYRDTAAVKDDLPAVTDEIKSRVEHGEEPEQATEEVIAAKRAEKEEARQKRVDQQAEFDRQREEARAKLPDAIKNREEIKQRAAALPPATKSPEEANRQWQARAAKAKEDEHLRDRVAELEDAVRVLEEENTALKAENKTFSEMKVEWEKGGFQEVVQGKDEVIRAQATRIEAESRDKASWMRSAKWWKEQAISHGYSDREVIDIETGEVAGG